jgi:hypothetical protein
MNPERGEHGGPPLNLSFSDLGFRALRSGFRCCCSISSLLLHELPNGGNVTG